MSAGHLTERQIEILSSLKYNADETTRRLLDHTIGGTLLRGDIEAVCQTINDEYLIKGIKEDYSPNKYGRELESLLDLINRPRTI